MARDTKTSAGKTGVAAWNESAGIRTRSEAISARQLRSAQDLRRRTVALVLLALVCVGCVILAWPIKQRVVRGLYLKEGVETVVSATTSDGATPTSDELSAAASVIRSRVSRAGVNEWRVATRGANELVVDLPWNVEAQRIAQTVCGQGVVEFVRLDEVGDADALAKINAGTKNAQVQPGTYTAFMDGSAVASAKVESANGSYAVSLTFTDEGAETFADVTRELAEEYGRIAILVDGRCVSAPAVSQEISEGEVSISGDFSSEEAKALAAVLNSDPIELTLAQTESFKVDALMGKGFVWGMVWVAAAVLVLVSVLAWRKFGGLWLVLAGTMATFALVMLGLMAFVSRADLFVLTLSAVLGGACAFAVTVFAAWRMVDRFVERARAGKSVRGAATTAPGEALAPFAVPAAAVFTISLVLLFVPWAHLHDFGISFVLGAVSGVCALAWYAVVVLRLLAAGTIQANPSAYGIALDSVADSSEAATS